MRGKKAESHDREKPKGFRLSALIAAVALVFAASEALSGILFLVPASGLSGGQAEETQAQEGAEEIGACDDMEELLQVEPLSVPVTTASAEPGRGTESESGAERERDSEGESGEELDEEPEAESGTESEQESGADVETILWDFFKSLGFTDAGAAAALGNLSVESGLDPSSKTANFSYENGRGGGGLAGWMCSGRFRNLYRFAQESGADWSELEIQMQFLQMELSDSRKRVGDKMCRVTDLDYATDYFCVYFEGCVGRTGIGNDAVSAINGKYYQALALRKSRAREFYERHAA